MGRPTPFRLAAVIAAGALVLSACGDTDDADVDAASTSTPLESTATVSPTDAAQPVTSGPAPDVDPALAEACPPTFADGRDGDAVASAVEDFDESAPVWLCRYAQDPDASDDRWGQWTLTSTPVRLDTEHPGILTSLMAGLSRRDDNAPCRADFGPRLLVSQEVRDGEQSHLVIDEFGCNDVHFASNLAYDTLPWTAPAMTPTQSDLAALVALVPTD